MKKAFGTGLIFIFLGVLGVAGQNGRISGTAVDGETGERIPYVTIAVYGEDGSAPVQGK